MQVFSSDRYELPLPAGHRFPIVKYRLLREAVESSGLVAPEGVRESPRAADGDLLLIHSPTYVDELQAGSLSARAQRRLGFPLSPELVERSRRSVGGTVAACRAALTDGIGVNLAGGTHHAFRDRGEGFCVFNDAAVAARVAQRSARAESVLIFDADVHQGNGTAAVFSSDPTVVTCSLHGRRNYPYRKQESDLDIELEDGTQDGDYLSILGRALTALKARLRPDLVIYLAGVDPYRGDRWGRLALSARGLAARDRLIIEHFRRRGVPLAVVMAGGYAPDARTIARLHLQTVEVAARASRLSAGGRQTVGVEPAHLGSVRPGHRPGGRRAAGPGAVPPTMTGRPTTEG
jgi:acetoin utilization deacetylase AcuC-like enzyme